ncbi:GNAT family N-acetyltransferase [Piscibacillus halophilus]|uniref:GNAT family N-acetyltransferase n=1 Tax=Piscibacillus halophilus TaxID=571933 RepID=UPI0024091DF5|nr:GNAT family N-acetyltransferase [Piscibacillus halophilus]
MKHLLKFKRVSECPIDQLVDVWNRGFKGYIVDVSMTMQSFLKKMVTEDLDPEHSVVAFDGDYPVGIVMTGFRQGEDALYAWNGGTAIDPEYRGTGVSHALMEEVLSVYKEKGVHTAYLEAISTNIRAIKLYEKHGYELIERLTFFSGPEEGQDITVIHDYELECIRVPSEKIQSLSFYQRHMPWQNQLESLKEGIGYILYDRERPIGYAMTKETYDEKGQLKSVQIYQLGIEPVLEGDSLLLITFLHKIFKLERDGIKRLIFNFPNRDDHVLSALSELGFHKTIEQVHMKKLL